MPQFSRYTCSRQNVAQQCRDREPGAACLGGGIQDFLSSPSPLRNMSLEAMSDSYPTHMLRNLMWAQWARFAFRPLPPHTSQTMQKGAGIRGKAAPGSRAPWHWESCRFLLPYAAGCSGREGRLSRASQVSLLFLLTSSGLVMTAPLLRVRQLI